jgi:hypothetical protein
MDEDEDEDVSDNAFWRIVAAEPEPEQYVAHASLVYPPGSDRGQQIVPTTFAAAATRCPITAPLVRQRSWRRGWAGWWRRPWPSSDRSRHCTRPAGRLWLLLLHVKASLCLTRWQLDPAKPFPAQHLKLTLSCRPRVERIRRPGVRCAPLAITARPSTATANRRWRCRNCDVAVLPNTVLVAWMLLVRAAQAPLLFHLTQLHQAVAQRFPPALFGAIVVLEGSR